MLIDLHAHYPMHLHGGPHAGIQMRRWDAERRRMRMINWVSKRLNYEGPGDTPDVTMARLIDGDVGIVLSVLHWPPDELSPKIAFRMPPSADAPQRLLDQLRLVTDEVEVRQEGVAMIVSSREELERAWASGKTGVVHCVEGGFALGDTPEEIRDSVVELHGLGVAYITLAHLFFRDVATNAPALPPIPDRLYHLIFRQPPEGLTKLGRAAVSEMLDAGIVIDVTHMSKRSLDETLALAEASYTAGAMPVIASHGAYRFPGYPEYNLDDQSIVHIARLDGVIGLICCTHYMAFRERQQPGCRADSVKTIARHINKIVAVLTDAGIADPYAHIGIGSDLDGYIKPALPGLKTIDNMRFLERDLTTLYPDHAAKICSQNALRMLRYRFAT